MTSSAATQNCPQCGTSCPAEHHYCPTCGFPVGTVSPKLDDQFIGQTLPGGYHILDLISVGGMGRVYRAEQSVLGRTVAVKIIHPHLLSDENSALRFMTEARAASQLNHPNSIAVFDFGRTNDGQPYLVMEFLRGRDLARVAYEEGGLPFARIVDVLRQVLAALAEAHELGIIHRDLKPENVVLEPLRRGGDFVKVLDFGLAKLKADTQSPGVTSPGIVCGTPDYMAPEQGRGDPIDGRSDLYAVGVILFQLLTGRLPFEAESPTQVVMMHLTVPIPDPRQVAPDRGIPDSLAEVAFRALAKEPEDRFQDAFEFSEALLAVQEQLAGIISPSAVTMPPPPPAHSLQCPSCGSMVPPAKFCLECGTKLPIRSVPPGARAQVGLPLPLSARDSELAFLGLRRAAAEHQLLGALVVADGGMGKTRLVKEFMAQSRSDGDRVAYAGPDPYWAEIPYHALRVTILQLVEYGRAALAEGRVDDASPEAVAGLMEIFGAGPSRDDPRTPLERRFARAEALRWALGEAALLATSSRILLVWDDLHRIDAPSRNALADVLGDPPTQGCLVIGTHPPGFAPAWPAHHPVRVLEALPPPTAARLLGSGDSDPQGAAFPREPAPLHIEELVRFALEGGSEPPPGLADLMARRLDTLRPEARRALQALAILGDEVNVELVSSMLGEGVAIEEAISSLVGRGMVLRDQNHLTISHPILREIVLTGTPAAVRRELHSKALRLSDQQHAPLEARALHAFHARDSFQALLLLEQVAEASMARGDTASEVLALRRGLLLAREEISRGELDDPLRAVLIFGRKLGAALTRSGKFADAEGVLREALDVAGPSGSDRARVLGALAHVARGRMRAADAMEFIDQAIEAARKSGAHDLVSTFTDTRRGWAC